VVAKLELVRSNVVGYWTNAVAREIGDLGGDEADGLRVAHDGVTGTNGQRVGCIPLVDGIDDQIADADLFLVTGEHDFDLSEDAALFDPETRKQVLDGKSETLYRCLRA